MQSLRNKLSQSANSVTFITFQDCYNNCAHNKKDFYSNYLMSEITSDK